jgi:sugar phosphate isomerase/epimerase
MRHEYSLAHLTVITVPPPQLVEIAARAGYEYASVRVTRVTNTEPLYDLARDRKLMAETRERLRDTGIRIHDVELFRMDAPTEPETFVPELHAAAELGAQRVIAQLPDPDRERATERFGRLCDLARPLGIFVGLEFPHWTETGTLAEAVRVLRAANRPNAGILIDLLHMGRSGSSIDELRGLPREWFRFAHVCDAEREVPPTMERILRTARCERLFPGEGSIDVRGILACLPDDIPYSLEIPRHALMRAVGPEEVARLALRVARDYLDHAGEAEYDHGALMGAPVGRLGSRP